MTLLHRLDPRVRVLSTVVMVMLSFAAVAWLQIALVAMAVGLLALMAPQCFGAMQRTARLLRWLLLFTFLMHLLLSPGRTLWGTSWLSLDGFWSGLFVCLQILLSAFLAVIMVSTTANETLVAAFGWFVKPLRSIGCRTDCWQQTLLLALDFLPSIHADITASATSPDQLSDTHNPGEKDRWTGWVTRVHLFVVNIVDRGDRIAHEIAAGERSVCLAEMDTLFPLARRDTYTLLMLVAVTLCYGVFGQL